MIKWHWVRITTPTGGPAAFQLLVKSGQLAHLNLIGRSWREAGVVDVSLPPANST
jgi:hypothetical protein